MLQHTVNNTTKTVGQATATVIADTIYDGCRITSFELVYPRYIHSEFMTHRAFSRNASSSRAIPITVTVQEVIDDPVLFDQVGKNQSGMVAGEEIEDKEEFLAEWKNLGEYVAKEVLKMSERFGVHKQILNRALEPWSRMKVLVTATDWSNFYKLRLAEDAMPEIQSLANAMRSAQLSSNPEERIWHLPYNPYPEMSDTEVSNNTDHVLQICVANCARLSYGKSGDGKDVPVEKHIELYDKLYTSGHASPFEHVAKYVDYHKRFANFWGWQSIRSSFSW